MHTSSAPHIAVHYMLKNPSLLLTSDNATTREQQEATAQREELKRMIDELVNITNKNEDAKAAAQLWFERYEAHAAFFADNIWSERAVHEYFVRNEVCLVGVMSMASRILSRKQ